VHLVGRREGVKKKETEKKRLFWVMGTSQEGKTGIGGIFRPARCRVNWEKPLPRSRERGGGIQRGVYKSSGQTSC